MKFGVASDLHLEFGPMNPEFFEWRGDVLLLAGDVAEDDYLCKQQAFWTAVSGMAPHVFLIAGNHEFYNSEIDTTSKHIREALQPHPNVKLLDNELAVVNGVAVYGTTLWTDFDRNNPISAFDAGRSMNDYRKIRVAGNNFRKFTPSDASSAHARALMHMKQELSTHSDKPAVIMSHHAPSFQSVAPQYATSTLNGSYASNLEQLIVDHPQIKAWVHGHIHHYTQYDVEQCQVILNARGYPGVRPPTLPPYQPLTFQI